MNPIFENINLSRRSKHILFWTSWVLSFTFIKSFGFSIPTYFDWLVYYLLTLPIFVTHTYLVAYWLIPKFFLKRKYLVTVLIGMLLLVIFSVVELIFANEIIFNQLSTEIKPEVNYFELKNIVISGIGNHYIIAIFLSVKILENWYSAENKKNDLHRDTLEAEIRLFQNQLHPRFLLSTIDYLEKIAAQKSEKTPDLIIRISNLLGNVFTEDSADMISVRKEVNLIESYLEIQKIVKYEKLDVQVLRSGDINLKKIPTLSFFPIIEKLLSAINENSANQTLKIFIRSEDNYLLFHTSLDCLGDDPYDKMVGIIEKTKNRFSFLYGTNYRFKYEFSKSMIELSFEIFDHD
ncbi:histidine kinase [Sunxiuqinia sp. A32]|uniref:histidine kinase n=1 Tax=Sunxiuqinia sp. A32 TaxID=3461496 RepID=UPI0040456197